jgi:hypothetical protein
MLNHAALACTHAQPRCTLALLSDATLDALLVLHSTFLMSFLFSLADIPAQLVSLQLTSQLALSARLLVLLRSDLRSFSAPRSVACRLLDDASHFGEASCSSHPHADLTDRRS